jgi:general secretion pathway protein A
VPYPRTTKSIKVLTDALNKHLLDAHASGRRSVLIIDEAQNLDIDVLEQIRLLTNLETATTKLLQIILVGQPELKQLLARPDLRQLAERITARYHLTPLSAAETTDYVLHRLRLAGMQRPLFARSALRAVHKLSNGVPRRINIICERALLAAYAEQRQRIDARLVRRAAAEVHGRPVRSSGWMIWTATATAAAVIAVIGWNFLPWPGGQRAVLLAKVEREAPAAAQTSTPVTILSEPAESVGDLTPSDTGTALAVPPTTPSLEDVLRSGEFPTDSDAAFSALFEQWGADYASLSGNTACTRAAGANLDCIYASGTWRNLRRHNRPAVLELVDDAGRRHHVALAALDGDKAMVRLGDDLHSFPRSDLDRLWYGAYLVLWRPPRLQTSVLRTGSRGRDVVWLRRQIDRAEGAHDAASGADAGNPLFDSHLAERVKAFQRRHGLPVDGIVGRQTLMALDAQAAAADTPRLTATRH